MESTLDYFTSRRRNALLSAAAALVGLSIFALAAPPLQPWNLFVTLAIGCVGIVALLWNHRRPRLVAGIVLTTAALTPIAAPAGWVMMFLLGLRYPPRVTIWFVVAGVTSSAGLFALYLVRWANTSNAGLATLIAVMSIMMTVGAGVAGIVAGSQARRNAAVTQMFLDAMHQAPRISERAAQDERARIARLLHDELGHNLALINLFVSSIETTELSDAEIRDALATIRDQNRAAATALANTVTGLQEASNTASLCDRLDPIAREVRRAGLTVEVQTPPHVDLGEDRVAFLVRTVQEGLTNAVKYASPAVARVVITVDAHAGTTTATVSSPLPREHDASRYVTSTGIGIRSLQKDAVKVGGTVSFATDDRDAHLSLMFASDVILEREQEAG